MSAWNKSHQSFAHTRKCWLRCRIYVAAKKWDECIIVAETLTDQLPNRPTGWPMLAAAEHGLGMTADAYETLCAVGEQFAELSEVTYEIQAGKIGCGGGI